MAVSDNSGQVEFWNGKPGQNWVANQPELDRIHAGVTDLLLAASDPKPGQRVLDIGCGAGASTFAVADMVGQEGYVLGIDVSEPLLGRAGERKEELGFANVAFAAADAQNHAFASDSFDLAVSRFGVMFFSDPVAAFHNIASALRPGGRLVFVAWAGPEDNPWFTIPQKAAVAELGQVEPTPPDAPGPMAFRDAARVLGILTRAGLMNPGCAPADIALHHPGGLDAVMQLVGHVGPLSRMMRDKNGTTKNRTAIEKAIAAEFKRHETDDGIRIPGRVNVFTAQAG